jgi:leader peptidase (prepilin peptidase)/N-methyltransferase
MITLAVVAGLLGLLVGSFLNVVIHRLPRGEPLGLLRMTRSQCPRCAATIRWYDNLPLVSYALLGGRCRACRERIALRYPLVEAVTAGLFVLAVYRVDDAGWTPPWLAWGVTAAFVAVCIAASAIDFQLKLLPDALTLKVGPVVTFLGAVAVVGIHGTHLFGWDHGPDLGRSMKPGMASLLVGLVGAATGGGIIWFIRAAGTLALKREAMGLGDVKFMAMAGLLLGPVPTLLALGVAMVGGSVLGLAIWAATRNREIPFGPFLALGALAVLFYGPDLEHFITVTYPGWVHGQ